MPDRAIHELTAAETIRESDLFVMEQSNVAKKITGERLLAQLAWLLSGHGGIDRVSYGGEGGVYTTVTLWFVDGTWQDINIKNGEQGEPGRTPIRGIDYWTQSDKDAMIADLDDVFVKPADIMVEVATAVQSYTDPRLEVKYDKSGGEISGNVEINSDTSSAVARLRSDNGDFTVERVDKRTAESSPAKIKNVATPTSPGDASNKNYVDTSISNAIASIGEVREITAEEFAGTGYGYIAYYVSTLSDGCYSYRPNDNQSFFFIKRSLGNEATIYECNASRNDDSSFRILVGYGSNMRQIAYFGGDAINYGPSENRQVMASQQWVIDYVNSVIGG